MDERERSDILERCLAKLTPLHHEVVNLIYYQGRKIEKVAQFTGAPINTIKTRVHHARNRMGDLLSDAGVDRAWVAILIKRIRSRNLHRWHGVGGRNRETRPHARWAAVARWERP
jgi:hypothetical protein